MKKITLLITLFIATIGFSQTLPLDFSDANQLFILDEAGGSGGSVALEGGKLRFNGNGMPYDQAPMNMFPFHSVCRHWVFWWLCF